jgi:hypothetical protein
MKYMGSAAVFYCTDSFALPEIGKDYTDVLDVNIPEFRLRYKGKEFPVSVGKPETPTPIGKGIIFEKIPYPKFIIKDGPDKGKEIKFCHTKDGEVVPFPKELMRSLGIRIYQGRKWGLTERYRIHSTTEDWRIRDPAGDGCIRLLIPDMLELYPMIPVSTEVWLGYDTIKTDRNGFIIFPDIYNRGVNTLEAVEGKLEKTGMKKIGREKIQSILEGYQGKHILFSEL